MDPKMAKVNRWIYFANLRYHALRSREMNSFNTEEIHYVLEFIAKHAHMEAGLYSQMLNRLVIDDERVRKSKRTQLWGCLLEASTAEIAAQKEKK